MCIKQLMEILSFKGPGNFSIKHAFLFLPTWSLYFFYPFFFSILFFNFLCLPFHEQLPPSVTLPSSSGLFSCSFLPFPLFPFPPCFLSPAFLFSWYKHIFILPYIFSLYLYFFSNNFMLSLTSFLYWFIWVNEYFIWRPKSWKQRHLRNFLLYLKHLNTQGTWKYQCKGLIIFRMMILLK